MKMIFMWLIFVLAVVGVIRYRMKRKRMYELASLIPSLGGELPIVGITHRLIGNTEDIMTTLQQFSYDSMKNDGLAKGWLYHMLYIVVTDPVDLEMILKSCLEKDDLHRFMRKVIGNGGIFAPVSIWRRRRKVLVPAFAPKILDSFNDIISSQSEQLVKILHSKADGEYFSVWPYLSSYTLDSVCETTMGVSINAQKNPNSPFLRAINIILNLVSKRIFHIWMQMDWMYEYFPQYVEHERCKRLLHQFVDEVIRKKIEELNFENQDNPEADHNYDLSSYSRKSFLDLLLSLSGGPQGYTAEELREEVLTLIIAGTDTTAVSIGYVLKLLAKYPAVQDKLHTELYEVFGDSERPLVKDDIMQLQYLDRVIKESLRLYPPVPFITRKIMKETKLPSGRVLPLGGGAVVSIWGLHRDPKYWGPDAEHFDPDRFLPDRFKLDNSCSFMPFSNGPRNCIGYQYAMFSVKTAVSAILRRYKVVTDTTSGDIKVKFDIMMKAVDEFTIGLELKK